MDHPDDSSPTAAPHPQEMNARVDHRIGGWFSLHARARATPAGLSAITSVVVATAWLIRTVGRKKTS